MASLNPRRTPSAGLLGRRERDPRAFMHHAAHHQEMAFRPQGFMSMSSTPRSPLALIPFAALLAASCTTGPARGAAPAALNAAPAVLSTAPGYTLGAGDKLRITTFDEPSLTGEFTLGDGGAVGFPLLGQVKADGLTVAELQISLERALRQGYLKEPRVSVEVLSHRPYYILGEVTNPGQYPYSDGLTVFNAVAAAGGFTYRANTKRLHIKRPSLDREVSVPLTATVPVQPGDTLRIGERYF
jgi:polysaccharide export outer membrane protein